MRQYYSNKIVENCVIKVVHVEKCIDTTYKIIFPWKILKLREFSIIILFFPKFTRFLKPVFSRNKLNIEPQRTLWTKNLWRDFVYCYGPSWRSATQYLEFGALPHFLHSAYPLGLG